MSDRPVYPKRLHPYQEAECRLVPHRCTFTDKSGTCGCAITVNSGLPKFGDESVLMCPRHHVVSYWDVEPGEEKKREVVFGGKSHFMAWNRTIQGH